MRIIIDFVVAQTFMAVRQKHNSEIGNTGVNKTGHIVGSIGMLVAVMISGAVAQAATATSLPESKSATIQVEKMYSRFMRENPHTSVSASQVGSIVVAQFHGSNVCHHGKCFTTVVTGLSGQPRQVLAVRAGVVKYIGGGKLPALVIDGVEWDYAGAQGYVASVRSAGKVFVPRLVPHGATFEAVRAALSAGGWPAGVPPLIQPLRSLGGEAPETLAVMPNMTNAAAQSVCAQGRCPLAFLIPQGKGWKVSALARGTGLMAVLRRSHKGAHEIGVGQMAGFEAFGWSSAYKKWLPAYTTYKSQITPVP